MWRRKQALWGLQTEDTIVLSRKNVFTFGTNQIEAWELFFALPSSPFRNTFHRIVYCSYLEGRQFILIVYCSHTLNYTPSFSCWVLSLLVWGVVLRSLREMDVLFHVMVGHLRYIWGMYLHDLLQRNIIGNLILSACHVLSGDCLSIVTFEFGLPSILLVQWY